jgi:hypothetical protein
MRQVIFGRRATFERGFAQVRLLGRKRHALVRWNGGMPPAVCLPQATEADRQEAVAAVETALILRRWAAWFEEKT